MPKNYNMPPKKRRDPKDLFTFEVMMWEKLGHYFVRNSLVTQDAEYKIIDLKYEMEFQCLIQQFSLTFKELEKIYLTMIKKLAFNDSDIVTLFSLFMQQIAKCTPPVFLNIIHDPFFTESQDSARAFMQFAIAFHTDNSNLEQAEIALRTALQSCRYRLEDYNSIINKTLRSYTKDTALQQFTQPTIDILVQNTLKIDMDLKKILKFSPDNATSLLERVADQPQPEISPYKHPHPLEL